MHVLPLGVQNHVVDDRHHVVRHEPHRLRGTPLEEPYPHQRVDLRIHVVSLPAPPYPLGRRAGRHRRVV